VAVLVPLCGRFGLWPFWMSPNDIIIIIIIIRSLTSEGTSGDAKCVTEILGGGRGAEIRKLGAKFRFSHILRLKCTKFDFGWGSAHSVPTDLLAGFKGPTSKGRGREGKRGRGRQGRKEREERGQIAS